MEIHKLLIYLGIIISASISETIPPGDDPVNTLHAEGITGLDFSNAGNGEKIAYFIINSNISTGFIVKITFGNNGSFKHFNKGDSLIPITNIVLNGVGGDLGTGLTAPIDLEVNSADEFTWDPGNAPTSVTSNYIVELKANWLKPSPRILAGYYFETINVTITERL